MKKLRVVLSALAILFAISAAFATHLSPAVTGYFYEDSGPLRPRCISSITCNNVSAPTCEHNGKTLQDSDVPIGGDCGDNLMKN